MFVCFLCCLFTWFVFVCLCVVVQRVCLIVRLSHPCWFRWTGEFESSLRTRCRLRFSYYSVGQIPPFLVSGWCWFFFCACLLFFVSLCSPSLFILIVCFIVSLVFLFLSSFLLCCFFCFLRFFFLLLCGRLSQFFLTALCKLVYCLFLVDSVTVWLVVSCLFFIVDVRLLVVVSFLSRLSFLFCSFALFVFICYRLVHPLVCYS